jgi:branched-chain amino acid transport system permease protein
LQYWNVYLIRGIPPPRARALIPPALAILALVLATAPWWITRVGLYPYLGVEILVWMLFALGYNLLLGHSGLPSFGHGAFFGVGAVRIRPGAAQARRRALAALGDGGGCRAAVAGALVAAVISHRAASTTRSSPSRSARCSGSSPSSGTA